MEASPAITLLVISLGAFLVPLFSGRLGVPAAVGEIVFGLLVGPYLLGIVAETEFFAFLAEFGFAFLMFLAGLELDFTNIERRGSKLVLISSAVTIVVVGLSFLSAALMGWPPFFGIVLSAMSIGIVLVSLRETGQVRSPFGQTVILAGSVGEFVTIILMTAFNIVYQSGVGVAFLIEILRLGAVFFVAYMVLRVLKLMVWWFPAYFTRMIAIEDPSEVGVRAGLALMIAFVSIAELMGMEAILGAFLAGALFSFVFREKGILETKLAGIGHGFFIPVFFIHVGVGFNLSALGTAQIYPLLAELALLSLLVKAVATSVLGAVDFGLREIAGAALLLSTPLTLLVAIAAIGLDLGALSELENSAVILMAVASALLFPTAYKAIARKQGGRAGKDAAETAGAETG
jgi:Kef-type K+ transport system membrane component KefB